MTFTAIQEKRWISDEYFSRLTRFGFSKAGNVLEYFLGTPDIQTNVLLLGSGDLRHVLMTASQLTEAYKKVNFHLIDESEFITARNILLAHIIFSDHFDPSNPIDLQYLWDVWYGLQWNEATKKRFIKDVKQLLAGQWKNSRISFSNAENVEQFKKICNFWLDTACSVTNEKTIHEVIANRLKCMGETITAWDIPKSKQDKFDRWDYKCSDFIPKDDLKDDFVNLGDEDKLKMMKTHLYSLSSCGSSFRSSFADAIDCFLNTGNCTPVTLDKIVGLNPTLLKRKRGRFLVNISSNPFEAYFPIPFNGDSSVPATNDTYSYCKEKLGSLVSEFIKHKERLNLHFHFGDYLDLCLYQEEMKSKCHVIVCFLEIERNFGLANVLAAAKDCLSETSDASVLLTNIYLPNLNIMDIDFSLLDYIETVAFCSLSMIPTIYGLKLSNHLKLGSPVCVKLHDNTLKSFFTLKWLKATGYSTNIKLDISPPLKKAIGRLAASRFKSSETGHMFSYQLFTYYFIIQSLSDRCRLFQDASAIHSLVQTEVQDDVLRDLRLAWRTEKAWLCGEPVLAYSFGKFRRILIRMLENHQLKETSPVWLMLAMSSIVNVMATTRPCIDQINHTHRIGLTSCREEKTPGYFSLNAKDLLDPSFIFLLPKDHGLDSSVKICVLNFETSEIHQHLLLLGELVDCCVWKVITNSTPFSLMQNPLPPPAETECGLQVMKCSETEDRYELDVSVRGVAISSANDVIVTTDRVNPSWSAHQVTLTLPNVEPLVFQVPWPFLSSEVKISLHKNKKGKKNRIRLVLIKSLHDPAPKEFGGRSKWDINLFRPWRDIEEHGTFEMHLDAQFQCDHLLMEKHLFNKEGMSALDEVREVVRAIFYGHHRNSFYLFAINHFLHPDLPVMHLRIQPPVRFSPPGSPLLLVSVLDHQLARKLIADGKLDRETHEEDFHRLITERVSREVCTIRLSSAEELNLFRYALRVNSTLMRRSVWQSKNLPRYEDNPWMPTFISPLYSHNTIGFCDEFSTEVSETLSRGTFVRFNVDYGSFDFSPLIMCAACFVKKIELKKCKQCKKVSYCSSACQKKHWAIHKSSCSI